MENVYFNLGSFNESWRFFRAKTLFFRRVSMTLNMCSRVEGYAFEFMRTCDAQTNRCMTSQYREITWKRVLLIFSPAELWCHCFGQNRIKVTHGRTENVKILTLLRSLWQTVFCLSTLYEPKIQMQNKTKHSNYMKICFDIYRLPPRHDGSYNVDLYKLWLKGWKVQHLWFGSTWKQLLDTSFMFWQMTSMLELEYEMLKTIQ